MAKDPTKVRRSYRRLVPDLLARSTGAKLPVGQRQLDLVTGNCEGPRDSARSRGAGWGKTAPPGLRRGRRASGVPRAEMYKKGIDVICS